MFELNAFVVGCNGRMGKLVCKMLREKDYGITVVGGYDRIHGPSIDDPSFEVSDSIIYLEDVDVVIDFSRPDATMKAVEAAVEYSVPMVIATTGFSKQEENIIEEASQSISIFKSANMSFGVSVLNRLVATAAKLLQNYDPEIHEVHHKRKADAPSGTALMLANTIADNNLHYTDIIYGRIGKRNNHDIGISSSRGGNVAGDHTVYFFGENDTISLAHHANDPAIFAEGAIRCAKYIANVHDTGIYTMNDLLNSLGI